MDKYAEIEISLNRRAEGEYAVDFRYSQPDSAVETRLSEQSRVNLDLLQLQALTYDPQAYAQSLSGCFFSNPEIKNQLALARSDSEALDLPLRLRLLIAPNAPELHGVYWEQLLDPRDGSPLFTGEKIVFSRYLSSQNLRPVKLGPKTGLRAMVFIANPGNLSGTKRLAPIDADGEFQRAQRGLGKIPVDLFSGRPATLNNLVDALREQKPAILYLVCHGGLLRGEPSLWLEDANGQTAVTPGKELVTRLKELNEPPLLVVLASCNSAGLDSAGDARAALGPLLAEAGIPAVVAVQGRISMETVAEFMPIFFHELQEDGQIDRAMALARGAVREKFDHWMPVLFTRLKNGCIFAPEKEAGVPALAAPKPRARRFWTIIAAAVLVVLSAILGTYWYATRPPWMGDGFNVVVATFTEVDTSGREQVTERSKKISGWLYQDIDQEKQALRQILTFELLEPGRAGSITGRDRDAAVRRLADQTNASLIIYGRLQETSTGYEVIPEFFVSDRATFDYGSEVVGSDRLGKSIPLGLIFEEKSVFNNVELNVRTRVLRNLMKGLALLSIGSYADAENAFNQAAYDTDWHDDDGKEVAFLLLGASQLIQYDAITNPGVLEDARKSFERAKQLNNEYSRAYLGLGEVTLLNATIDKGPQGQADLIRAAEVQYQTVQRLSEPGSMYSIKASFGLGRAALLRFVAQLPGYTAQDEETAKQNLQPIIQAYKDGNHNLAFPAAEAHKLLSYLAGNARNWDTMASEAREAVAILEPLTTSKALLSKARCLEYVAWAEQKRGNIEAARVVIQEAIRIGKQTNAAQAEIKRWEDFFTKLEE